MKPTGTIAHGDRKLLWWAGGAALLLVGGTFALSPGADADSSTVPSTYSSGSGGARAAYLLLLDLGYDAHRWEESPDGLEEKANQAILILAEPTETPTMGEQASLLRFVEGGGEILFCGAALPKFFPEVDFVKRFAGAQWTEFSPSLPSRYSRNAEKVVIQPEAYWPGDLGFRQLALYGGESNSAVVLWRIGSGQVLWWAGATPLTNAGIRQADNLNLFLNSVSNDTPAGSRAIYWDEYFHGERGSLWTYLEATPVIWGAVQIFILALALLFTFSRRSGPIAIPAVVSRLSPLEFVNTMAGLYQRAGATQIAVGVTYRHLRLELTHRLGLAAATPDPALAQAAEERLGRGAKGLEEALQKAALASDAQKLRAREALDLVQSLQRYAILLTGRLTGPSSKPAQASKPAQEKM